jgi:modification methylase
LQFGSKIDKDSSTQREELFTVKEVISPELLRLNNDLTIKLIGIKEDPQANGKATSFLVEKTKGKRVFLKYDNVKHDKENNLLCYLYLENKTFINAHLIKNGLVQVDNELDFKYKDKFLTLLQQYNG